LWAVYVSGQYGVILPANFLEEKEEMKLKVYIIKDVITGFKNSRAFIIAKLKKMSQVVVWNTVKIVDMAFLCAVEHL
jgi:flagellar assembly factor FliW